MAALGNELENFLIKVLYSLHISKDLPSARERGSLALEMLLDSYQVQLAWPVVMGIIFGQNMEEHRLPNPSLAYSKLSAYFHGRGLSVLLVKVQYGLPFSPFFSR